MNKLNILVTDAGSTTALSVMKGLRLVNVNKYKIIGTDINQSHEVPASIFCNSFYNVPNFKSENFIEQLIKICKKEKVNLIIPIVDKEVEKITKYKEKFKAIGTEIIASDQKAVRNCNDKLKTYLILKQNEITTPKTFLISEIDKIISKNKSFFIKPRSGVSSKDCFKINSLKDVVVIAKMIEDPILQEFIEGDKYVIDVINDKRCKNIVSIPRLEICSKAGIGTKAVIVEDKALSELGKIVSELMEIKGPANIEVIKKNNKLSVIEINPRFSAGSILTANAGVNIFSLSVDIFLGKKIKNDRLKVRNKLSMIRYWNEVYFAKKQRVN